LAAKTKTEISDEYLERFEKQLNETTKVDKSENEKQKTFSILDLFRNRTIGFVSANIGVAFMTWNI